MKKCKQIILTSIIFLLIFGNFSLQSTAKYTNTPKASKIKLNKTKLELAVGQSSQLKVKKVTPKKASKSVYWKSSNKKIATVNSKGKITAKKPGTVKITATSKWNKKVKAVCKVKVYHRVKKIKLNISSKKLMVGEKLKLKTTITPKNALKKVTWKSSNSRVASVNKSGVVCARNVGRAKITVYSLSTKRKTAQCTINVVNKHDFSQTPTPCPSKLPTIPPCPTLTTTPSAIPTITSIPTQYPIINADITKAEWIHNLVELMNYQMEEQDLSYDENGNIKYSFLDISDNPYRLDIEAALMYKIITVYDTKEMGYFNPNEKVTRDFAAMTVTNALGFFGDTNLVCEDSENIKHLLQAQIAINQNLLSLENNYFYPDRVLSSDEQLHIFTRMNEIIQEANIIPEDSCTVEYCDNVTKVEVNALSDYKIEQLSEDNTFQVTISTEFFQNISKNDVTIGDIVIFPAVDSVPNGITLQILSITTNENNHIITGNIPKDISQVYKRICVSGTVNSTEQTFEAKEGVQVQQIDDIQEIEINSNTLENLVYFNKEFEKERSEGNLKGSMSGSLKFAIPEITYDLDIDFSLIHEPKVHNISLSMTETLDITANIEGNYQKTFNLGKILVAIPQIPGLALEGELLLEMKAGGKGNLKINAVSSQSLNYSNGNMQKSFDKPKITPVLYFEANATAEPQLNVSLIWPSILSGDEVLFDLEPCVLFDTNITMGVNINSNLTSYQNTDTGENITCLDELAYFYLNISAVSEECILHSLLHPSWVIFDENNSPWKLKLHLENGKTVSKCTCNENNDKEDTIEKYGVNSPQISKDNVLWDCIWFGNYYQSNSSDKEPIKWRILAIDGNNAYIIADKNLDAKKYNEERKNVTWETCSLRKWLNTDFFNAAFNEIEQNAIIETEVINKKNPIYGTGGGNNTKDKLYFLSFEEASNTIYGFARAEARVGKNTEYVTTKNGYLSSSKIYWSWLRSPGLSGYNAADIRSSDGYIGSGNNYAYSSIYGVRPVLHIDLSKTDCWHYAGKINIENEVTNVPVPPTAIPVPTVTPTITTIPNQTIIYSGAYEQVTWTIDKNGLLEVNGNGDMYDDGGAKWLEYKEYIKSAKINVSNTTRTDNMFANCENLTSVDFSNFDTSKVVYMGGMFYGCANLEKLDLNEMSTKSATDMTLMFGYCYNLKELNLSNFDTRNVTGMYGMFTDCSNLINLDLTPFNTEKVTAMGSMFYNCSRLEKLNMSSFDTCNVKNADLIFQWNDNLTLINTPQKTGNTTFTLPEGTWKDSQGTIYSALPLNASSGIEVKKITN